MSGSSPSCAPRRLLALGLSALQLVLGVPGARAEETNPSETPQGLEQSTTLAVDSIVQRAAERLDQGSPSDALALLEQAAVVQPSSTRVRVHLAAVHQALGDWVAAEAELLVALRRPEDPYVKAHRAALDEAWQAIQQHLGTLSVLGEPPGARVLLDGEALGSLPLHVPARVLAGEHVLEISAPGYRPWRRDLVLEPTAVMTEIVRLEPERVEPREPREDARAEALPQAAGMPPKDAAKRANTWLPWALTALGGVAAGGALLAYTQRERHADRWNSDECLAGGRTRGEVCADERRSIDHWDDVLLTSGIASGLFFGGALVTLVLLEPASSTPEPSLALTRCGLRGSTVTCSGQF